MRIIIRVALLHQSSVSGTKARFFPFVPGLLLAARAGIVAPALALMVHRRRKGRHYCSAARSATAAGKSPRHCTLRRNFSSSPPKRS